MRTVHIKPHHIKSRERVSPQKLGLLLVLAGLLTAPAWAQSLLNLDTSPRPAASLPAPAAYAPAEPPAASVPGTLYVPPEYERELNESDEAFIARMKIQQEQVKREQAALLAQHNQAMAALAQSVGPRARTADDDERLAAYNAKVQATREQALVAAKRVHATAAIGVTTGADEMLQPKQAMPAQVR